MPLKIRPDSSVLCPSNKDEVGHRIIASDRRESNKSLTRRPDPNRQHPPPHSKYTNRKLQATMAASISSTAANSFSSAGIIWLVLSLLLLSCPVTAIRRANRITGTGQLRRGAAGEGRTAAFSRRQYTFASIAAIGENGGVVSSRYHEINPSFINRRYDDAKTNAQSRSSTSDEDDAPLVRCFEKFRFGSHM